jgi:sulfatase-modifying factor enzyme 1/TIR domain-containing protein
MLKPVGFWSYARQDDQHTERQLSGLHRAVCSELALLHGEEVTLWKDDTHLKVGKLWEDSIKSAINTSTFFIPILSPRYFKRKYCIIELNLFKIRQKTLGRQDLIFPLQFIDINDLRETDTPYPAALKYLKKRQMSAFSPLRGLDPKSRAVQNHLRAFAKMILEELRREELRHEDVLANKASSTSSTKTKASSVASPSSRTRAATVSERAAPSPRSRLPEASLENVSSILPRFAHVKAATAEIGSEISGRFPCKFSHGLEVDPYLVTQSLYEGVMGSNPSEIKGANYPVVNVSWYDAVIFCNRFSDTQGFEQVYTISGESLFSVEIDFSRNGARLPTECEWEHFASPVRSQSSSVDEYAWFSANSAGRPHDVGTKLANENGLFDVLGNVWEWCSDWFGGYPRERVVDWAGPPKGALRVCRGGSWANFQHIVNVKYRGGFDPSTKDNNIGFRLVTNSKT